MICAGYAQTGYTNEKADTWRIDIYPYDYPYNPINVSFSGKLYKKGNGISLTEKKTLDNSEQFLRYAIHVYKTGTIKEIIELWHPDEREKLEFLGKDEFHIKEKRHLNVGNAIEVRLLSRISYGDMLIYHVLAKGLEKNKLIRYALTTSKKRGDNRYFLTKKLQNRSEYHLFHSYTKHLESENKINQTFINQ